MMHKMSFGFFAVLALAALFSASPIQGQSMPDSSDWEFSVLSNFSTFTLDGQFKVFEAPIGFGVAHTPSIFDIGLFIAPVIQIEDETVVVDLSTILHGRAFDKFGLGFGYTWWTTNIGLIEPTKSNLFFTLSYELLGPETNRAKRQAERDRRIIHLE